MPADSDLNYIDLQDFTPGIFSDFFSGNSGSGAQPAPDNAAQETGTWGCVASPAGGLIPAPRRVNTLSESVFDTPFEPGYYPGDDVQVHIGAFKAVGPININGYRPWPVALFYDHQYYFDSTGAHGAANWARKRKTRLYKMSSLSGYAAGSLSNYPSTYDLLSTSLNLAGGPFVVPFTSYGVGNFAATRSNKAAPTSPGSVVVAFTTVWGATAGTPVVYPSNATPTVDSTDVFPTTPNNRELVVAHQNRFVLLCTQAVTAGSDYDFGGSQVISGQEVLWWTNPNDYSTSPLASTGGSVFFPENPGGIGVMHSMNASTLIVVKTGERGGGYIVNGDISNPQITQLPGLPGCGGMGNEGAIADSSMFVYGTRDGVYGWQGGDSAQDIAPQLDGCFWETPEAHRHYPMKGKFAYLAPFLYAPNNWILDFRTRGWWKLTSPSDVQNAYWDVQQMNPVLNYSKRVDMRPCVIGAPLVWTPQQPVIASWYTHELGQSYWTWTSQPYQRTLGRVLEARELEAVVQGVGTITLTITGLNGVVGQPWVIQVNSPNQPVAITSTYGGTGAQMHDPIINIQSVASNPNNPAPRWVRGRVGYREIVTAR